MECSVVNSKLVTLTSAVNAAIIDKYEEIGKTQQRFLHWGCREIKLLYNQILPKLKYKETLTVNQNTFTATLPLGFESETFIGGINERWQKIPLKLNNRLVDSKNIAQVACEDACPKCQQDTNICNDLVVTETDNLIVINDTTYVQTIVKKLYPNGDYYLETTTPILGIDTDEVTYVTKKEFITNFDLKPCGCLDTTAENIVTLQNFCPDIYCNYYAPCQQYCDNSNLGYRIFEETGLIQFDRNFPYDKVYIEYNGYIQKIRGQYYFPFMAFETVVEGIKKRAIKDKPNVARWQILDQKEDYRIAKRDLQKVLGRISFEQIVQAINKLPKFDFDYSDDWYGCFNSSSSSQALLAASTTTNASGECCVTNTSTIINRTAFVLSVKVDGNPGSPVNDTSTYQNNVLKNAIDLEYIFLENQIFTKKSGAFTFDPATGTIDISPNKFFTGDTLVINYNKNLAI